MGIASFIWDGIPDSSSVVSLTNWAMLCRSSLASSIVLERVSAEVLLVSVALRMSSMQVAREVIWSSRLEVIVSPSGVLTDGWAGV